MLSQSGERPDRWTEFRENIIYENLAQLPASEDAIQLQEELQRGILAALSGEKEIHVKVKDSEKTKR